MVGARIATAPVRQRVARRAGQLTRRAITRRGLLRALPSAAVGLASLTWMGQQPFTQQMLGVLRAAAAMPRSPIAGAPNGYFHACFNIERPEDVPMAAALGINFAFGYGSVSWRSVDPTNPLGQALARYGMRAFLDIESAALSCRGGRGVVDSSAIRGLVARFASSPLLAGYWTKDDDCGDEGAAVKEIATIIRSVDADPRHLIVPGYGDAASLARNYVHGQADVLAFYPYPAFSRGPAAEVPEMLRIVRERTPAGAQPPPFLGIYQVFGAPPHIALPSVQEIVDQVAAYRSLGALGVVGYGWDQSGMTHLPSNDATLRAAIAAATQWMITGPGRAYTRGIPAG